MKFFRDGSSPDAFAALQGNHAQARLCEIGGSGQPVMTGTDNGNVVGAAGFGHRGSVLTVKHGGPAFRIRRPLGARQVPWGLAEVPSFRASPAETYRRSSRPEAE